MILRYSLPLKWHYSLRTTEAHPPRTARRPNCPCTERDHVYCSCSHCSPLGKLDEGPLSIFQIGTSASGPKGWPCSLGQTVCRPWGRVLKMPGTANPCFCHTDDLLKQQFLTSRARGEEMSSRLHPHPPKCDESRSRRRAATGSLCSRGKQEGEHIPRESGGANTSWTSFKNSVRGQTGCIGEGRGELVD